MRYKPVPRGLLEQTKQLVQLHLFLRHDIGLKEDPQLRIFKSF